MGNNGAGPETLYSARHIIKEIHMVIFLVIVNFYLRPKVIFRVLLATRSPERLKYIFYRIFRIVK